MKKVILFLCAFIILSAAVMGQYSELRLSKKQLDYTDSLKKVVYHHTFPLLGQKAYKMGVDIPYPAGVMTNYFGVKQGLIIDNLQLGLLTNNQNIPLTPISFIGFSNNTVSVQSFNVRPDLWIFPFLDLYGVFGYGSSTTTVNVTTPITFTSVVKQNVSTAGLGITGAFGLGPLFVALDANWTWNKPDKLDKPVPAQTFSIRLGHTFQFANKPTRNIGIWVGAMRAQIGSGTEGQITLADALPASVWERKDEIVNQYYAWYNGLNPANPADKIKIQKADDILTPIIERISAADGSATVRYALDKRPAQEWNMLVGGQFQLNKRWAFRTEGGVLGDRKSILLSANYRFFLF
jgi:hypothetical protein